MTQDWEVGWPDRLAAAVASAGFDTLRAFSDARPAASWEELRRELGGGYAPAQLQGALRVHAVRDGWFPRFVRMSLARHLADRLPDGWQGGADVSSGALNAFGAWTAGVGRGAMQDCLAAWRELAADLPIGWLPAGPDDPRIVAACAGTAWSP